MCRHNDVIRRNHDLSNYHIYVIVMSHLLWRVKNEQGIETGMCQQEGGGYIKLNQEDELKGHGAI